MSKSEKGRLDKYCEIVMGQSPSGESYNYEGKGLKLIAGAGDFGEVYPKAKKYTTEASKISKYGDIVLGIRASIGDKVLSDGEYCLGRGVAGLRPLSKLDARYLWHWLDHVRPVLSAKAKGATFKQVNREDICELEISILQLEEQKRIAEILDRTQSLISKRKEAIAKLDTLTQSIFLEMFGDPVTNQKKWKVINMSECAERIQIGPFGTQLHEEDYIDNGIPLINPTHIKDGKIFPNSAFSISSEKHQELSQYNLEVDDVILGRRGEMGRCAIISENENGWLCGTGSLFIRPKHELLNSFYLFCVLSSQSIKKYLEKASQGVTMANLNKTIVSQIPMAIPPLSLQKEFAQRVEAVEKLKATHRESLSQLEALFASLQHRAFRGEL
ncbi:MAG: type I restriction endonuclease subunit R [Pseudanabaena sp.]|nr:MAG: type I restriction endonuclease subunit R [Pseudanabaena sp.]